MIGMYLFQRFLNRMDDFKFEKYWEDKFVPKQRTYWFIALLNYFFVLSIISELLLYNTSSFFIGFLVIVFTALIYGGYFIKSILKFVGVNNSRYLRLKQGIYQETSGFSKDNVVG